MSIYGEGLYGNARGEIVPGRERAVERLQSRDWEVRDAAGERLSPLPTPETKTPSLASVYALSKYDQERMCLLVGQAYDIPTVALRFFNVFGTRQALSNPYTGVLAIFASRLLNDRPPVIFEDGRQKRDFVCVLDVAQACRLALQVPAAAGNVFNVGSGRAHSVLEVAQKVARALGKERIEAEVSGTYRVGDIRHCVADIRLARDVLGYRPAVTPDSGMQELADWLRDQAADDGVDAARAELDRRGLAI